MGEYAKRSDGKRVKIGTCELMYYLRYEDRKRVSVEYDLNMNGLFWRLPFPDEDHIQPGEYQDAFRAEILHGFSDPSLARDPGMLYLEHNSGLRISVPCYHGEKLPDVAGAHWNGKTVDWFELKHIKKHDDQILPVLGCRHCRRMWRINWHKVLDYIGNDELKYRLEEYA